MQTEGVDAAGFDVFCSEESNEARGSEARGRNVVDQKWCRLACDAATQQGAGAHA